MTRAETIAFNAGVSAVLALAKRTADTMRPSIVKKPTRFNFAVEALDGLAEEGRGLLIAPPDVVGHSRTDKGPPTPSAGGAMAKVPA